MLMVGCAGGSAALVFTVQATFASTFINSLLSVGADGTHPMTPPTLVPELTGPFDGLCIRSMIDEAVLAPAGRFVPVSHVFVFNNNRFMRLGLTFGDTAWEEKRFVEPLAAPTASCDSMRPTPPITLLPALMTEKADVEARPTARVPGVVTLCGVWIESIM